MSRCTGLSVAGLWVVLAGSALMLGACASSQSTAAAGAGKQAPAKVSVDGQVALHSLMSLADTHLQKLADSYALLASMDAVRSADWDRVRPPLSEAAGMNVSALHWFALPDGSYWTLEMGRAQANLADRAYFPRVMEGQTILGDLVVSKATGKSTAIVAVPVFNESRQVVGVLGASVYLEALSQRIKDEMKLGPKDIFYSLDQTPIVGLHKDPQVIFVYPLQEEDPQLQQAIRTIITHDHGLVSYNFRGQERTILYQKSPVTGWWYGFGKLGD